MHAPANQPAFLIDTCRHDGWTRQRRRSFLEALAEGQRVERACAQVGMSKTSAYKLRHRDPRFAFAWSAALQYARPDRVLSLLNPAVDGQVRIVTRKDGSVENVLVRCRIDTPIEIDYYQHGGILPYVLRQIVAKN